MVQDLLPGLIDHRDVDWQRVSRAAYLVRQRFRYEYTAPVCDLRHRLIVVPPENHGDQRMVLNHVSVSLPGEVSRREDAYGNTVVEFGAASVESSVELDAWIALERGPGSGPTLLPADWLSDRRLLEPAGLTAPDDLLVRVAARLSNGCQGLELAEAANQWTHSRLTYRHGVTGVHTTAAAALQLGVGVCQDYAHVMLALCRLAGLPARYVSGHLLGEGGTHAWVEVLVEDPAGSPQAAAFAFDPTHGRKPGMCHLTVATGADYGDVAPTSGVYTGAASSRLLATKRVDVTALECDRGRRRSAWEVLAQRTAVLPGRVKPQVTGA
jgi:transglutaminase-like putative cysteine protease